MADPEIVALRTVNSKTFDLGANRRRVALSQGPIHAKDASGQWQDITTTITDQGTQFAVAGGWYDLAILKGKVGYSYTSKHGGTVSLYLSALDGVPVGGMGLPSIAGGPTTYTVTWNNVATRLTMYLLVDPARVELFKRIEGQQAPRSFTWEVTEPIGNPLRLITTTAGHDNADLLDNGRPGSGVGRLRRSLVLTQTTTADDGTIPGSVHYHWIETWTGETIALDAQRNPTPSTTVVYPVLIDTTVNETIAADADDGQQRQAGTWDNQQLSTGDHIIYEINGTSDYRVPGYRFITVAIPNAATINSATLTYNISGSSSSTGSGAVLYGRAHDNAPAWASDAGPNNMTRTSANVSFTPWGGGSGNNGAHALTVTTIVQEIVNRAGWASGNALAFGVQGTMTPNGAYSYINDLAGGASNIARLDIEYTSGPVESPATKPAYGEFPKFLLRRAS